MSLNTEIEGEAAKAEGLTLFLLERAGQPMRWDKIRALIIKKWRVQDSTKRVREPLVEAGLVTKLRHDTASPWLLMITDAGRARLAELMDGES